MTIGEFKAWLSGFEEAIAASPNKKQWTRIKERLSEVAEEARYHDWYPNWYRQYTQWPYWTNVDTFTVGNAHMATDIKLDQTTTAYTVAYDVGTQEAKRLE